METKQYRVNEYDQYLFGHGTHYEIYKKLGAHPVTDGDTRGTYFAVWAPHAAKVFLMGEFNGWSEESLEMERQEPLGIYDLFVPGACEGQLYKYVIVTKDGEKLYKADPFASSCELRPGTNSRIADLRWIKWHDAAWRSARARKDMKKSPMSIYEVHLGSWKKHPEDSTISNNEDGFYTYRQIAEELPAYVSDMGYTHVELMGIEEYPFDGSWGYQVTGYFAPTSRYGTPEDFAYLIDTLHQKGIGVILDWVPAHFPRDAHGLRYFDGEPLYEYPDPRKGEHAQWGTMIFNYEKSEVSNFLIASALNWVEQYHIDALRVDAVASMLYLNYGRKDGEWEPNKYGGEQNLEAVEFFRHLNTCITGRNPGVQMIAEESTSWPGITAEAKDGGLNFTYKWNMGWMNDFLEYVKLDSYFRKFNHNKMTFAMTYAYSENFILVLSHDEVVHLKKSMLDKMPGVGWERFAGLMTAYTFMMGHPGKKLLFMGQDFGQWREWSEARELDWFLLAEEEHRQLKDYVKDLLHVYREIPANYELDHYGEGFRWVNCDDASRSIFSFIRKPEKTKKCLLYVCNFTPIPHDDYRVGVPCAGSYKMILSNRDKKYGGWREVEAQAPMKAVKGECDGQPYSIGFNLGGCESAIIEFTWRASRKPAAKKAAKPAKKVVKKSAKKADK